MATKNLQEYTTQIGLYIGEIGHHGEGSDAKCAVTLDVECDAFKNGGSRGLFTLKYQDGTPIAGIMLGEEDLKRLALQILMGLF